MRLVHPRRIASSIDSAWTHGRCQRKESLGLWSRPMRRRSRRACRVGLPVERCAAVERQRRSRHAAVAERNELRDPAFARLAEEDDRITAPFRPAPLRMRPSRTTIAQAPSLSTELRVPRHRLLRSKPRTRWHAHSLSEDPCTWQNAARSARCRRVSGSCEEMRASTRMHPRAKAAPSSAEATCPSAGRQRTFAVNSAFVPGGSALTSATCLPEIVVSPHLANSKRSIASPSSIVSPGVVVLPTVSVPV